MFEKQTVFVPDFVFEHKSGQRVLLEIVGFGTPEYLAAKRESLRRFGLHRILLAIVESIDWPVESTGSPVSIRYKTALKVSDVLVQLEALRNSAVS